MDLRNYFHPLSENGFHIMINESSNFLRDKGNADSAKVYAES